jgi:NAD(P)-dependent dehydrogenase (short-subunit alcohol dehydrogenase family)
VWGGSPHIGPVNIVIAGASHGLGHALFIRLSAAGHRVLPLSRSVSGHNLTDPFDACLAANNCDWSHVDALIVTAGNQPILGPLLDCPPTQWVKAVSNNLSIPVNCLHAFRLLLNSNLVKGRPKIILLSGGGATEGRPYFSAYACAKTSIVRLVETLAMEQPGWDVNAVAPGAMGGEMLDEVIKAGPELVGQAEYAKAQTLRGTPDKAVDLIEWLISPEADKVTGKLISAVWDQWGKNHLSTLQDANTYKLRRTTP